MSSNRERKARNRRAVGLAAVYFFALAYGPALHAQTVNLGGTGALGAFINPTSVLANTGGQTCGISIIQIDLAQGKVFAIPDRTTANSLCADRSPVDITSTAFPGLTGPINDGVLEVTTFTLQEAKGPSTFIDNDAGIGNVTSVVFVPNANNTPVWLRATGNITINAGTWHIG